MTSSARYDVHVNTAAMGLFHAADCVVEEDAGSVRRVDFRYTADYLVHPGAFPLDPEHLPLVSGEIRLSCQGGVPGFIDDYLPDAWGRKVLAAFAFYRHGRRLSVNSVIDVLALVPGGSRIGAVSITPHGEVPHFASGVSADALAEAENAAVRLDSAYSEDADPDMLGLVHLANAGSSVGGARPKVLLTDDSGHYVAKFNRLAGDGYNNARVELACLNMARAAGLEVSNGRVLYGVDGRDVLLLERFDVAPGGFRHHLTTVNSLMKERETQRDAGLPFRYDDIADLLCRHSVAIESDLKQLARLALFNRAINNTDDHSRNFSLINRGDGFCLSPAYDLVPSLAVGEYHAAGFAYRPRPPRPGEVSRLGRVFGLSKPWLHECGEEVLAAIQRWPEFAERTGVVEAQSELVASRFNP